MKANIDIKSALFGLVLGVLATVAIAGASTPGQIGRYQITGTNNQGLVLDTATGQVWASYFPTAGGRMDRDFFSPKGDETK